MARDAIQRRRPRMPSAVLLRFFNLLPLRPDRIDCPGFGFAEDVRMAANECLSDMPANSFKIECAATASQLAREYDLEQQGAQFLHHFVVVAGLDSIDQFINF